MACVQQLEVILESYLAGGGNIGRYEGMAIVVHRVQLEGEREINQ